MTTGFERHLRTFSRRNAWISPEMGALPMRVIANSTLKKFWEKPGHRNAEALLLHQHE